MNNINLNSEMKTGSCLNNKRADIDSSRAQITKVNEYQGEGIEGYPYY